MYYFCKVTIKNAVTHLLFLQNRVGFQTFLRGYMYLKCGHKHFLTVIFYFKYFKYLQSQPTHTGCLKHYLYEIFKKEL